MYVIQITGMGAAKMSASSTRQQLQISEDLVDSKRLIVVLNINPELPAVERDRIQEVIIKNH